MNEKIIAYGLLFGFAAVFIIITAYIIWLCLTDSRFRPAAWTKRKHDKTDTKDDRDSTCPDGHDCDHHHVK